VNGNLNLSRAIGDLKYKGNSELLPKDQIITAQPDVVKITLQVRTCRRKLAQQFQADHALRSDRHSRPCTQIIPAQQLYADLVHRPDHPSTDRRGQNHTAGENMQKKPMTAAWPEA
jgi:hypothetical protein